MNPSEPIRPFSTLRFLYAAVLLLGGLLVALPSTAAAQTPCPLSADTTGQVTPQSCPGLDAVPPTVTIAPSSGTFTNASLAVTIEWCDNNTLNSASRKIMLNGAVVTSSFGYTGGTKTGCGAYATSTGTVDWLPAATRSTPKSRTTTSTAAPGARPIPTALPPRTVSP